LPDLSTRQLTAAFARALMRAGHLKPLEKQQEIFSEPVSNPVRSIKTRQNSAESH
jgi:hypothetical protein